LTDALELELRQLAGVLFVSFAEDEGNAYLELVVAPGTAHAKIREQAARLVANHLDNPAEIRICSAEEVAAPAPARSGRVRLCLVLPSDGGASIEVRLSRGGQRATSRAVAGDTRAVGRAVLEALHGLGAKAPYELVGFHALPSEWGAGVLAILKDPGTGELRRGVASGRAPADAAARAVLDALNRSI
jgi:hypothetical protein